MKGKLKLKGILRQKSYLIFFLVLGTVLLIYTFSMLLPLGLATITSLKSRVEYRQNPFGWPKAFEWKNYLTAFQSLYVTVVTENGLETFFLGRLMLNAIVIACVNSFIPGWVNVFVAYLTVRFKDFKFSKIVVNTAIVMMMLPIGASLSVTLAFRKSIGMYDNLWMNLIPSLGWGGTGLFIYRSLFAGVGNTYCEAAEIDGAGEWTIMTRIMIPFVMPMYMAFFVMGVIGAWGEYSGTLVWLPSMPTIGYALFSFNSSTVNEISHITVQMAGCMLTMIPVMIIFIIFHDFFMKQVNVGGIKG